jgi:polyisoprenoid-binding protein YceI
MKRLIFLGVTMVAALAIADVHEWKIDPNHTSATFKVKHLGITQVPGSIQKIEGKVVVDDKDLSATKVSTSLDVATISTGVSKRDEHLKSADFFDVAQFPKITFESTKVNVKEGRIESLDGNLTIHGVTKKVNLKVDSLTDAIKNPAGNWSRGISASAKISRKDFGLTWNKLVEGIAIVGDEVDVAIDMEILRPIAEQKKPNEGKKG